VRIDSTNPGLVPDGAGEAEVAAYVAEAMRALGLAMDEIQQILDALADADATFDASCEAAFAQQPFEAAPDAPIAEAVRAAGAEVLGQAPPDAGQTFWTDAAPLAAVGTETVVLGPVGDGLHTTEEWVDLDSVVQLAEILARTAQRYCA
jgi:Acetylornithine deacetylase/Succinyl-diaminopimelate desuccinylase and related deacylases